MPRSGNWVVFLRVALPPTTQARAMLNAGLQLSHTHARPHTRTPTRIGFVHVHVHASKVQRTVSSVAFQCPASLFWQHWSFVGFPADGP